MKTRALAVCTAMILALGSAWAKDKACCAGMGANESKEACSATFANLTLTTAQKTKMEKLAAECDKGGCNERTMAKMEAGARKVLNKEQFAQWRAACAGHMSPKTQS